MIVLASGAIADEHRRVWRIFQTETQQNLEPAPIVDRVEQMRAERRATQAELCQLDSEMKTFRATHHLRTDAKNRIVGMQSSSLKGRAAVERTWAAYNLRANRLLPKFAALSQEIAVLTVPGYTKEENR